MPKNKNLLNRTATMTSHAPSPLVLNNDLFLKAVNHLTTKYSTLMSIVEKFGIPNIKYRKPGFSTLLYIILEQQVSLASAAAVYKKLLNDCCNITPESFLAYNDAQLRGFGFSRQKSEYCRLLSQSVLNKELKFSLFSKLDDDDVRSILMKQKGIGKWTSDIYLLFELRRADIWPRYDLALINTIKELKKLRNNPDEQRLDKIAKQWRPWRSVAARLLWHHYLSK
jgi:DNA-3-methyladenine glycosylase II